MKTALRTRASLACRSCQYRKVKCNAQTVAIGMRCTPCQQMDLPCIMNPNGDRRKSGSRRHIETLEQRILDLEGVHHRMTQSRQEAGLSWEHDVGTRSDGAAVPAPSGPQMGASEAAPPHALRPPALALSLVERLPALISNRTSITPSAEPCASFGDGSSGHASVVVVPTSQNHAPSTGMIQPYHQRQHHYHSYTKTDEFGNLEIGVDTNTVHSKRQLLQSFFKYQPLWVAAVDEELFWEHRESRESSMWYSNFLEAAMLASAARLSHSSALRSLGEQYSIQAKADIIQALENPSAASMQGFLMLSEYEVSQGRESMGWQLCGMACRLLTDLGLHEPPDASGEAETTHMKGARLRLLSACIALEGVWCMYLGRPSSIRRSVLQAAALSCEEYQWSDSSTLAAWLGLCGAMADICEVLNSSRPLDAEEKTRLSRLSANLYSWFDNLPAGFVYDEPNAYGVLMQYCKARILVQQASGCGEETAEVHRVRIYDAAIRIIRLLLIYRQAQGNDQIRSVMLDTVNFALATLVDQYLQHPDLITTQKCDIERLRLAIESMINIQPHFPIISRMLQSLAVAVEGTLLSPLFKAMEPLLLPTCSSSASAETYAEQQTSAPESSYWS